VYGTGAGKCSVRRGFEHVPVILIDSYVPAILIHSYALINCKKTQRE
jgi:hypothetical protein